LLEYENAHIGHLNEKSLNGLVKETKDENAKMMILTVWPADVTRTVDRVLTPD
jgi:hypothetical protein